MWGKPQKLEEGQWCSSTSVAKQATIAVGERDCCAV